MGTFGLHTRLDTEELDAVCRRVMSDTGVDLATKFISISIAVMWRTVGMTELQVTRVAFASNELPTELAVRQYVIYNVRMLLTV
jgi:hypothetical protein